MSDWEDFEKAGEDPLAYLAERLERARKNLDEAQAEWDLLTDQAIGQVSRDFGEHELEAGPRVIRVKRAERYTWDQDLLATMFEEEEELPEFVNRKLAVDKRKFDKLDDKDKEDLLPALTRKPGPVTVTVEKKNV